MEENANHTVEPTRRELGKLFRRSGVTIRMRLIACFVLIVLLMIAADVVAVWQFRQVAAPAERLSKADQTSHAIVRVHLDIDTFRDAVATVASGHDVHEFSNSIASIRRTFLRHIDEAEEALRRTPDIERDEPISNALESLRVTLLSQLDSAVELASAGDWNAIQLRLGSQISALIEFSSSIVERVDHAALQQRTKANEAEQQARRRLGIVLPIAALLTLLTAAALGWHVTRTITAPLSELTACAETLAQGNFQSHVNVRGDDEMAVLGKAFNYAARHLQQLYEDLRRSEAELREVINAVPAHVWSASPDGTIDFINERLQRFVGLPSDGVSAWDWQSIVHPDDRARFAADWDAAFKHGQSIDTEVRVRQADGQYCWFLLRNVPLRTETGKLVKWYGSGIEIQDRKRAERERERLRELEAELAHVNRVSMLGELAASLSHELKQPIGATVINAKTSLLWLKRDTPDLDEVREAAERIAKDGARAAEIIDRVRSLYKKSPPQRELLDVNGTIREMVVLLRGEADRYAVSIRTELAGNVPEIMADRVQLQQVLLNLMLNAIEAMQETGGVLTVRSQFEQGSQVLLSVCDTGVGLPAQKGDDIFNAFFTTKPQGSGMGLAISRSIVESHGGYLWATKNSGLGATFHFSLPTVVTLPAMGTSSDEKYNRGTYEKGTA
jgi:PAS domain S-box-containing protein